MTRRKQDRNEKIRKDVKDYEELGYTSKQAITLVAERYYLAETTVRDLIYKREKDEKK